MWLKIKEWCMRNRAYLATLFVASLVIGLIIATLCTFFPPALAAIAGITIFGMAPLAFLTAISFPFAVFTLSSIMTSISFGVIAGGIVVMKQLSTIGAHILELFNGEKEPKKEEPGYVSYDYFSKYLKPKSTLTFVEDEYDEDYDVSSEHPSEVDRDKKPTQSQTVEFIPDNKINEGMIAVVRPQGHFHSTL